MRGAILLALALVGCGMGRRMDDPPDLCCGACAADTDCGQGERCGPQHLCVECLADGDCVLGEFCEPMLLRCTSGCRAGRGCPAPLVCDADAGACAACAGDADCPSGTLCRSH